MDPRHLYVDERHAAFCVFCGDLPTTREHVVSRILLDDPLPEDLPLVRSCQRCNSGFSRDEEYLACVVDCILSGSTNPVHVQRPKVRSALRHSRGLTARLEAAHSSTTDGRIAWNVESDRIRSIIIKLARAHVAHQYSEPKLHEPSTCAFAPLDCLSSEVRAAFETVPGSNLYPEIGSRAFMSLLVVDDKTYDPGSGWNIIQPDRYRYFVAQPGETLVRLVLSEYLAAEVVW